MPQNPISKVYFDSVPLINLAKHKLRKRLGESLDENEVWFTARLLNAARDGNIEIYTSMLTVAECTHCGDGKIDEKVKEFYDRLLLSGKGGITLIQPTYNVIKRARDLTWDNKVHGRSVDRVHLASALEIGCSEFYTGDGKITGYKTIALGLGLSIVKTYETKELPDSYRQEELQEGMFDALNEAQAGEQNTVVAEESIQQATVIVLEEDAKELLKVNTKQMNAPSTTLTEKAESKENPTETK